MILPMATMNSPPIGRSVCCTSTVVAAGRWPATPRGRRRRQMPRGGGGRGRRRGTMRLYMNITDADTDVDTIEVDIDAAPPVASSQLLHELDESPQGRIRTTRNVSLSSLPLPGSDERKSNKHVHKEKHRMKNNAQQCATFSAFTELRARNNAGEEVSFGHSRQARACRTWPSVDVQRCPGSSRWAQAPDAGLRPFFPRAISSARRSQALG